MKARIAVCIPYFERMGALIQTLKSFKDVGYSKDLIEISMVDDGSIHEPLPPVEHADMIDYLSFLPPKDTWKNPSIPLNMAIRQSKADVICLQSPEAVHLRPILPEMLKMLKGKKDIVCAAAVREQKARDIEEVKREIDKLPVVKYPKCAGMFWWCQLMNRSFFEEIGGFDEAFRDGGGGEDTDFIGKATMKGARWIKARVTPVYHVYVPNNWKMGYYMSRDKNPNKKILKMRYGTAASGQVGKRRK